MSDKRSVVKKANYWLRIGVVLNVCVKEALLDILHDLTINGLPTDEQQAFQRLKLFRQNEEKNLKGVLKPVQWDKIAHCCDGTCQISCPKAGKTNTDLLDITAIVVLIINVTTLPPPQGKKGWKQALPQPGDGSKAANVLLARDLRNKLNHGSIDDFMDEDRFNDQWDGIEIILLGLVYKNMQLFHDLKETSLDPYLHEQIKIVASKYEQVLINDKATKSDLQKMSANIDILNQTVKDLDNEKVNKEEWERLLSKQKNAADRIAKLEEAARTTNINIYVQDEQSVRIKVESAMTQLPKSNGNDGSDTDDNSESPLLQKSHAMKVATKERYKQTTTETELMLNITNVKISKRFHKGSNIQRLQRQVNLQLTQDANDHILLDYDEVISSQDDNIIIWGCPGSGKTSLIDTLLKRWAINKLWSSGDQVEFHFVFVLYFRQLNRFLAKPGVTALSILKRFYPDVSFEELRKHNAKEENQKLNCLLIMDGFDEFAEGDDCSKRNDRISPLAQAVCDLFRGLNRKLPDFARIVTSRLGKTTLMELLSDAEGKPNANELLLTGFDYDGLNTFLVDQQIDETKIEKILKNNIYDMMTIPFYCRGICELIKSNELTNQECPITYTALYSKLLTLHLWKSGDYGTISLSEIYDDERFRATCIMLADAAYRLKQTRKIVFTEKEFSSGINIQTLLKSGLIIEVKYESTSFVRYQFLHYSFQEFLIALHCFHTGSKIKNLYNNNYIISLIAGLLGASLENSTSNASLQRFSRTFDRKAETFNVFKKLSSTTKPFIGKFFCSHKVKENVILDSDVDASRNAISLYEYGLNNSIPEEQRPLYCLRDTLDKYTTYDENLAKIITEKEKNEEIQYYKKEYYESDDD